MDQLFNDTEMLIRIYFAIAAFVLLICLLLLSKQYFRNFFKKDLHFIFNKTLSNK